MQSVLVWADRSQSRSGMPLTLQSRAGTSGNVLRVENTVVIAVLALVGHAVAVAVRACPGRDVLAIRDPVRVAIRPYVGQLNGAKGIDPTRTVVDIKSRLAEVVRRLPYDQPHIFVAQFRIGGEDQRRQRPGTCGPAMLVPSER